MDHFTVVLDPGHGGSAPGAVWPPVGNPEFIEKDLNFNLALEIQHLVDGSHLPINCEMTREEDEEMDFITRAAVAEKHGAQLLICLHHNTSPEAASGLMVFIRPDDQAGGEVAQHILDATPRELRRGALTPVICSEGNWTDRALHCLRHYKCPAVLVECAFLTSSRDRQVLSSEAGRAGIVVAILAGIVRGWRLI